MRRTFSQQLWAYCVLALLLGSLGCEADPPGTEGENKPPAPAAEAKKALVGKNVWLEVEGDKRRVLVAAVICLRQGLLEQFMTRKQTKEHEAIVAADVDARDIHKALLAAGAEAGSPVRFEPKYVPARGSRIKVSVQYEDKGKLHTVRAQQWIRDMNTRKDLEHDWVFGGSRLEKDRLEPNKIYYLANDGDIICVSNFESAMLDLPVSSPKEDSSRVYEAHTERIPELGTRVTIILEPIPEAKKK